jgi:hypothetical protein
MAGMLLDGSVSIPTEFFTAASVLTFTGVTGATFVVTNASQKAFNFNPTWLGLAIAIVLCEIGEFARGFSVVGLALGLLNGCLVFCTVAGSTSVAGKAAGSPVVVHGSGSRRGWFSPWF